MTAGRVLGSQGQAGRAGRSQRRGGTTVHSLQEPRSSWAGLCSPLVPVPTPPWWCTPALLSSCLLPALLLQNQCLSSPPSLETKPFASQYRSICKQGRGGRPGALRSPRSAFRVLFSKCSLSSHFPRSIFPAPLTLGLTLWSVFISRSRGQSDSVPVVSPDRTKDHTLPLALQVAPEFTHKNNKLLGSCRLSVLDPKINTRRKNHLHFPTHL